MHIAYDYGIHLLITLELALSSYPLEDLLFLPDFHSASTVALDILGINLKAFNELDVLFSHPLYSTINSNNTSCSIEHRIYNAASLITGGEISGTYLKCNLSNTDVFDEVRYFHQIKTFYI